MIRKAFAALGVVAFLVGASGCSSTVPPKKTRAAIPASEVMLYDKVPGKYEVHGVVRSEPVNKDGGEWKESNNWKADDYVNQLKAAAGAMGANGILIAKDYDWAGTQARDDRYIFVGAFYNGKFYDFPVSTEKPPKVLAIAVYVLKP